MIQTNRSSEKWKNEKSYILYSITGTSVHLPSDLCAVLESVMRYSITAVHGPLPAQRNTQEHRIRYKSLFPFTPTSWWLGDREEGGRRGREKSWKALGLATQPR